MKNYCILLLTFFSYTLSGQTRLIELKNEPLTVQAKEFYIKGVIDARPNQSNIGIIRMTSASNKKVLADLSGGLKNSFENYLNSALEKDTARVPIMMRVTHLRIFENTESVKETAEVQLKVEFYRVQNNMLGKVYETEANAQDTAIDVTDSHEHRIKETLKQCLNNFSESDWQSATPEFKPYAIDATKINSKTSQLPVQTTRLRRLNFFTFNLATGLHAEGWELCYGTSRGITAEKGWFFPFILKAARYEINSDYFKRSNYKAAQIRFWMPGVAAYKRWNKRVCTHLSFTIPIGSERLLNKENEELKIMVFGLFASQGICIFPRSRFGLVIGVDMFERLLASEVYKNDWGVKLVLGVKFTGPPHE